MQEMFQVGAIASTHGVKGEVKVFPTTDDPGKFKKLKKILLETKKEKLELEIQQCKFFKNMVILKFKGIDTLNDVEKYKGATLWIDRTQSGRPKKDEYFQADLIGLSVIDEEGQTLGELTDVMQTGANDVYEVTLSDGKVVLFPAIKECILKVDMDARVMTVHVMDGLLDV